MSTSATRVLRNLQDISVGHLWVAAVLVAVFAASSLSPIFLGDFWWHLRLGETIASTRQIPATDAFSFVAQGNPFIYQQWLGELYLYALYVLGGLELVVMANALALTVVAVAIMLACREAGGSARVSALCTLAGMILVLPNRDVRPQILGFLLFSLLTLLLWRRWHGKPAHYWMVPVLMAIWANLHGSFLVGLGVCGIVLVTEIAELFLKGRRGDREAVTKTVGLALATALGAAATIVNPWGLGIYRYVADIQGNPVIRSLVTEWASPRLSNPADFPLFALLTASTVLFILSPRSLRMPTVALFLLCVALALQAGRNSVWVGIGVPPIAAGQLATILRRRARILVRKDEAPRDLERTSHLRRQAQGLAVINCACLLCMIVFALLAMPWAKSSLPVPPRYAGLTEATTPIDAVRYVQDHLADKHLFHLETYGSYMIWATPQRPRVFVDTRIELYSPSVWEDYIRIWHADGWESRLAKYGVEHVMLPIDRSAGIHVPLLQELERSSAWKEVYRDDIAAVYERRDRRTGDQPTLQP